MKTIVITGSTRGIGYGLADSFLDLGCAVVISSRTPEHVEEAMARLSAEHNAERVFGIACDVTDFEQVQALWNAARDHYGEIDTWINNAGISHRQTDFCDHSAERIRAVVSTNLIGTMYGSKVALRGMLDQGSGEIYSLEGLGSDGRQVEGLAVYGTTKAALRYLNQSLAREAKGTGVLVGALRPGMVLTDLVMKQYEGRPAELERVKSIFNIIADQVETVTPWLARRILANERNGAVISWLPWWKLLGRFALSPFRKRDPFKGLRRGDE
ncbi:MAG: SDR family NAD(P)-dependent oxidoreductase [Anaerolineae bacterium]|jgi:NAD(P)-dependent dehydrogenase (short-subunit alcohol dehydrogenase family)